MLATRFAPFVILAACGTAEPPTSPPVQADGAPATLSAAPDCGADDYRSLVGNPLAAVSLPADLDTRIIRPGEVVTMEYVGTRMTIEVDEDGVVTAVRCG
ncbi:I78 family peptidase inhibitor [Parvularcula dongshanensis]|uniref:Peptidase inhibitor I78 family protein n=1 Tax=Parvularcula dongshanensis TaxID=1173995 RepID=A0A840I2G9_9PROT|nr:I78 family peptidase inhibitor [Parvularcula dongshanensis]MBB4658492.1 hypothetical protein [Parvularcula dongshanensis]